MVLFGVVFALGADSAVAQDPPAMTLSVPNKYELAEGGTLTVTIKASIARAAGAAAASVAVTVTGANDTGATPPDDAEPAQDYTISPGVVTLEWDAVGSRAPRADS